MSVLSVNHVVQFQERPEEGDRLPENAVTGGCELTYGCWEANLGPLEEQ